MFDSFGTNLVALFVVGATSVTAYVVFVRRKRAAAIAPARATLVFFGSGAVVIGARICHLSTRTDSNLQGLSEDRLFLFLAGVCVMWLGIDTVRRMFAAIPRDADPRESQRLTGP